MIISKLLSQSPLPRLEAEILLAFVLQQSRTYLHVHNDVKINSIQEQNFLNSVKRRVNGEPIAYIIGEKEFWSLSLKITPDVLIPRPETELLVELILQQFPDQENFYVADLGTGSGAIALALAKERPHWRIIACDSSIAALSLAQENAQRLKIPNVDFQHCHWCEKLPNKKFNVIVSNPPYIAVDDPHLQQGDLRFEPRSALVAEQNGLAEFSLIASQATTKLLTNGYIFFEHGFEQAKAVQKILQDHGFIDIKTIKDLSGHERTTHAKLHNIDTA